MIDTELEEMRNCRGGYQIEDCIECSDERSKLVDEIKRLQDELSQAFGATMRAAEPMLLTKIATLEKDLDVTRHYNRRLRGDLAASANHIKGLEEKVDNLSQSNFMRKAHDERLAAQQNEIKKLKEIIACPLCAGEYQSHPRNQNE